jgi:hypothetical protein
LRAILKIRLPDSKIACFIAQALSPDNSMPVECAQTSAMIRSSSDGAWLVSTVSRAESVEMLISTLNDILRCLHAAQRSIEVVRRASASDGRMILKRPALKP